MVTIRPLRPLPCRLRAESAPLRITNARSGGTNCQEGPEMSATPAAIASVIPEDRQVAARRGRKKLQTAAAVVAAFCPLQRVL